MLNPNGRKEFATASCPYVCLTGLPPPAPMTVMQVRAVITGPADTPYEGGLFVFDVYFPAGYPQVGLGVGWGWGWGWGGLGWGLESADLDQ